MLNLPDPKDPDEILNYQIDWTARLGALEIATSLVTAPFPAGTTIISQANSVKITTFTVSGGITGQTAMYKATVTTADGLSFEETVTLSILDSILSDIEAKFLNRFPEFRGVPLATIQAVFDEIGTDEFDNFDEKDRQPALFYLTAHKLSIEGYPGRLTGGLSYLLNGPVKRRKVGDVETEFQNQNERMGTGYAANIGKSGYEMTPYGRQYLMILRRNISPVYVV